uniref:Tripartite motif-containing protein 5 n=1 Tax=Callithrix jacchus TaxID=9483 RepID=F7CQC7_CALJA|nr:E3 ubiquitin-protein ligase TRIM4 isoform X2 [Callithrix jacchus]
MEVKDLQEELTCSICLDYFRDPVSIECGHNFCRSCLHRSRVPGSGPFPCPECRHPSAPTALRPNWALARLTEKTQRRRQGPVPPGLCGRHWEPLRLFCEDDQRPVCLVCRESQEHQTHAMAPIDEAVESYRKGNLDIHMDEWKRRPVRLLWYHFNQEEKLLQSQCNLGDKMKTLLELQEIEAKIATRWKDKIKSQRMRISTEFSKLHNFLVEEEDLFIQRLSKEEEETKTKLNENRLKLNQTISSLKKLIVEVGEKRQAPTLELLQNPKDVLTRSEIQDVNYSLEAPKVKTVCQIPLMKEMLKRFQVAVNLAEDTAHPKLVFSQEGRYVKNVASASSWPAFSAAWNFVAGWRNPQKTAHVEKFQHLPCVLGKNVFTSGKHYWEIERRDGLDVAVGVCREDVMGITDHSKMSPDVGIWAIYWSVAGCWPLTGFPGSPIQPEPTAHRVGVYLDRGTGNVSFYSAVDGVHLHTFSCSSVSRLRPFFWLSPLASLVIPPVTDGK